MGVAKPAGCWRRCWLCPGEARWREGLLAERRKAFAVASNSWRLDQHPPRWVLRQMREEHWPLGSSRRWYERLGQLGVAEVNPVHEKRERGTGRLVAIECDDERQEIDWSQRKPLEEALSLCLARLIAKRQRPGSFAHR